jgi:hypothetical protein
VHWSEVAFSVASEPQSIARIRPRRIWLGVVQVASHEQIEMAITVDVGDDDCLDRCDLSQIG